MTDSISPPDGGIPALDYERVKDYFFEKLAADRHGRGRMESALYHTAQWIFLQGCARQVADAGATGTAWTRCEDALPDDDVTVLITMEDGEVLAAHMDGDMWRHDSSVAVAPDFVTHWMHFPEPPHA